MDLAWRTHDSDDRHLEVYTIGPNISRREDGIDLGYEEYRFASERLCFNKDFYIARYREPTHSTAAESAIALLEEQHPSMMEYKKTAIARLISSSSSAVASTESPIGTELVDAGVSIDFSSAPVTVIQEAKPLDCVSLCDSGDSMSCAIRGYPPDQEKLKSIIDKLRLSSDKESYAAADVYEIFSLPKSSCTRSDITATSGKIFNTGQYCSLPITLGKSHNKPTLALHFPEALRARKTHENARATLQFDDGVSMPSLNIADQDRNANYGGLVMSVSATDNGVYYQTATACIFVGVQ